jgi:hypothetical protein
LEDEHLSAPLKYEPDWYLLRHICVIPMIVFAKEPSNVPAFYAMGFDDQAHGDQTLVYLAPQAEERAALRYLLKNEGLHATEIRTIALKDQAREVYKEILTADNSGFLVYIENRLYPLVGAELMSLMLHPENEHFEEAVKGFFLSQKVTSNLQESISKQQLGSLPSAELLEPHQCQALQELFDQEPSLSKAWALRAIEFDEHNRCLISRCWLVVSGPIQDQSLRRLQSRAAVLMGEGGGHLPTLRLRHLCRLSHITQQSVLAHHPVYKGSWGRRVINYLRRSPA